MKTKKTVAVVSSALLISSMFAPLAFAKDGNDDLEQNANIEVRGHEAEVNASMHMEEGRDDAMMGSTTQDDRGNGTTSRERSQEREDNASTTDDRGHGESMSEQHQSVVAAFVHSLLGVADREGGIGEQVRTIAQNQERSASTSVEAIAKVEGRGALHTLLLGSDYRSLAQLKAEIATTSANITALKDLLSKATSEADKTELSAQIQALEDSQAQLNAFVDLHEKSFSFFGWFAKLFSN